MSSPQSARRGTQAGSLRRFGPVRYIASIVLSYLTFLFLTLFISGLILLLTAFNPSYMVHRAGGSGYSRMALSELQEIYISHGAASGVPQDVMLSTLTQKHVENAMEAALRNAYCVGPAYPFDVYENELYDALMDYALGQGAEDSAELREGLRGLSNLCAADFERHVVSPALGVIGAAAFRNSRIFATAVIAIGLLAAMSALLLWGLNRRISGLMGAYVYALGAAALVCGSVPAYVFGSGAARRLGITPPSYNRLFSYWIEGIAEAYLIALIPILLMLAVFVSVWFVRRRRRRRLGHR